VERRFREGFPAFKQALLQGASEGRQANHSDFTAHINSYMHQAEKRLKPIFHFFLDQFGQELLDAFRQMDQNSHLDAAAQTNMCSKEVAKVIFQDSHLPALNFLDRITVDIFFDVGRMLGILLNGFLPQKK
jgi:DNA-binding MurR/RpiR family transcriptional regulator